MINAGFTCPNRDGKVGTGGCSFCRTDSFSPSYCVGSIKDQITAGKKFFAGKYPEMKYLAYFQSYTNTYGEESETFQKYQEALACDDVIGIVVGTRPDCLSATIIEHFKALKAQGYIVQIEIGVESFYDRTLKRVNRGHTVADSVDAIKRCAAAGLEVCIHIIFGLPGETRQDILGYADFINALPVTSVKIHQLQILRGTKMAEEWTNNPEDFLNPTVDEYVSLVVSFIRLLHNNIKIERFASSAPKELLLSPSWGLKPQELQRKVERVMCNVE